MDRQAYLDEIRFKLTGGVLELELDDTALGKVLDMSFREIQRYIDSSVYETIPYQSCIDLNPRKINTVVTVFRTNGANGDSKASDPMYLSQWQMMSGGSLLNMQNYLSNYESWNTMLQIRNTISTDLAFLYEKRENKLYINVGMDTPEKITIEYIPRFDSVEEIISDFWIDKIILLAVAQTKVTLGRIRTRFSQQGALWAQDGETILSEGKAELDAIRADLTASTQLAYPLD